MRPSIIQFLVEHLVEPHPFAAQAVMAEFGEPVDASVVHADGSLTVHFAYSSAPIDHRTLVVSHSWRFGSIDSAATFRGLIKRVSVQVSA